MNDARQVSLMEIRALKAAFYVGAQVEIYLQLP